MNADDLAWNLVLAVRLSRGVAFQVVWTLPRWVCFYQGLIFFQVLQHRRCVSLSIRSLYNCVGRDQWKWPSQWTLKWWMINKVPAFPISRLSFAQTSILYIFLLLKADSTWACGCFRSTYALRHKTPPLFLADCVVTPRGRPWWCLLGSSFPCTCPESCACRCCQLSQSEVSVLIRLADFHGDTIIIHRFIVGCCL